MKSQRGFTLIELLVVIAIIGVLAAIIIPNVTRYTSSGELAAANAEARMVQTAVVAYMADTKISSLDAELTLTPETDTDNTTPEGMIADFVTGKLKGDYTVSTDGKITGNTYPYGDSTKYEWVNDEWVRKGS